MNEIYVFGTILILVLVFAYLFNKKLNFDQEQRYNNYHLAKKRLVNSLKSKNKLDDDIDDQVEDFVDSMPSWMLKILQGAGIDIEKLYHEDAQELQKMKNILEKIPTPQGSQGSQGGNLIG